MPIRNIKKIKLLGLPLSSSRSPRLLGAVSLAFAALCSVSSALDSEPAWIGSENSPVVAPPSNQLANGVGVVLSGAADSRQFFTIDATTQIYNLVVTLAGSNVDNGDTDLYIRFGEQPVPYNAQSPWGGVFNFVSEATGNNESITIATPAIGTHHVLVHGWYENGAYTNVTLRATWSTTPPTPPTPPQPPTPGTPTGTQSLTSITRGEITWEFDKAYQCGNYANGDWFVVRDATLNNVKIINITPASVVSPRPMHGSMLDPLSGWTVKQGFDSDNLVGYDAALNVGRPGGNAISAGNPLVITGGSLLSSKSILAVNQRPQLEEIQILTVVSAVPPSGSFRPPYCGTDKTHRWNKSQLDYSKLLSLAPVASTPDLTTLAARFEKPWIEINTEPSGADIRPLNNQPEYGRDIGYLISDALLSLHLNYSNPHKETLLIRIVQYGIDIYGAALTGGLWNSAGGHNQGRKAPMIFAGRLLNDANILARGNAAIHKQFQCDLQFFRVSQADVDLPRYTADGRYRRPYVAEEIETPEWGESHNRNPTRSGANWDASYRSIANSALVGGVLAIKLMELQESWNNPVVFEYFENRYVPTETPLAANSLNRFQLFHANMWAAYAQLQPEQEPQPQPPLAPTALRLVDF